MKSLVQFITESAADKKKLIKTNYGKYTTFDELCCKEKGFDDKVTFGDIPAECGFVIVDKTSGKLIKQGVEENDVNPRKPGNYLFTTDPRNRKSGFPIYLSTSYYDTKPYHIYVVENSKRTNIVILVADPKNNDIVAKVAEEHLDLFDTSSPKLTKEELDTFEKFFNDHVENVRCVTEKGTFAAYFADKDELKDDFRNHAKGGYPHIGISKPNSYWGGFCVTVYYPSRIKWDPKKYPGEQSNTDKEGLPKLRTVDDVCELMLQHLDDWAKDLKFTVKK